MISYLLVAMLVRCKLTFRLNLFLYSLKFRPCWPSSRGRPSLKKTLKEPYYCSFYIFKYVIWTIIRLLMFLFILKKKGSSLKDKEGQNVGEKKIEN